MRVAVKDHYGEAVRYARALHDAGHEIVTDGTYADALLVDLDTPILGYRALIDHYAGMGAAILQYPHGAGPMLGYDGLWEPYDAVDAQLVHAAGYAELLRRIEYPHPAHAIGWSYCELAPFRACATVRRVLYAPTHPNAYGELTDRSREANAETYARLLEGPWELTVRHLGSVEENGLWAADGVRFHRGQPDLGHAEIDAADVVVAAEGTFPCLSVARGAPTVLCAQGHPPIFGLPGEAPAPLRRPERYTDYLRYPLAVGDGPLDELLHAAAAGLEPIADWKRRFVGAPFDDHAFTALVERLIDDRAAPVHVAATAPFTVVAFADEVGERPELLAAYAAAFGPDDDVSLVLWGVSMEEATLVEIVDRAVAAGGLDAGALADVLLLSLPGSPDADRVLAERASVLLSAWPRAGRLGALARCGADPGALRAAAIGFRPAVAVR